MNYTGQPTTPEMPRNGLKDRGNTSEDSTLKVRGLTIDRYLQLKECEQELHRLKMQIAACAKVKTEEIDKKERKFREERQKLQGNLYDARKNMTDEERRKLENLENEYIEELEHPQIIINEGKAEKLILSYIGYGMSKEDRHMYRFDNGAPRGSQVKIE